MTQLLKILEKADDQNIKTLAQCFYEIYKDHQHLIRKAKQLKTQEGQLNTGIISDGIDSHVALRKVISELLDAVFSLHAVANATAWRAKHARKIYVNSLMNDNNKLRLCMSIYNTFYNRRMRDVSTSL